MSRNLLLYGRTCEIFVADVVRGLLEAASSVGVELAPLAIEEAVELPARCAAARRVYVLPFDIPPALAARGWREAGPLLQRLFPDAEIVNGTAPHELGWDKRDTARRLLSRGVPLPETLITVDPAEVHEFVARHDHAILREPASCGGQSTMVLYRDAERNLIGQTWRKPYFLDLRVEATPSLSAGVLTLPPPYFVQRLVASVDRDGVLSPAQLLRAFVVDGQVVFWLELCRERARGPGDFVVGPGTGGKYRFVHGVSEEVRKVAMRAAEVIGIRVGAVDLIRSGSEGPFVLKVRSDGQHMFIDRGFLRLPEWRSPFDFDRYIVEAMAAPLPEPKVRRLQTRSDEERR